MSLIDSCFLCQRLLFFPTHLCKDCRREVLSSPLVWRDVDELPVFALFDYVSPLDQWIKLWKNPKERIALPHFARCLAEKFSNECLSSISGVIPMPAKVHGEKDHAYAIAEMLAEHFKVPLANQFLTRNKGNGPQKEKSQLGRKGVRLGLKESFDSHVESAGEGGGLWILVDDVVTTGSTLVNAWNLLGRPPAVGLALASTPRWSEIGLLAANPSGAWSRLLWN